jgi:anti-anti-sigma regulatory factor
MVLSRRQEVDLVVFQLSAHGTAFSTRTLGAKLLDELIEAADEGAHVVVDFSGVRMVSYSFADEFVGGLASRCEASELTFAPTISNIGANPQRIIRRSLANRNVAESILAVPAVN